MRRADVQTLQALLQMIEEKQKAAATPQRIHRRTGLSVVIGAEHLDPNLRPFSLVLSTYDDGVGHWIGWRDRPDAHALLARDSQRVDGAAQAVSRMLKDSRLIDVMADEPLTDATAESSGARRLAPLPILERERDDYRIAGCARARSSTTYRRRIERERRRAGRPDGCPDLLQEPPGGGRRLRPRADRRRGEGGGAYRKGVELIHGKLHDLLRKQA
jgi:hypothetical protein